MLDNTLQPCEREAICETYLRLTTRDSLTSTWRHRSGGRVFYETKTAHDVDLKLRMTNLAPTLLQSLRAADSEGKGYIHQHELQQVLLVQYGVLLGAAELECLKAEWQVLDAVTQRVDYERLCQIAASA